MKIYSELSGREWIPAHPPEVPEGFFVEDVPRRVYVNFSRGTLIVGERTQAWLPYLGALPFRGRWAKLSWWYVVWSPRYETRIKPRHQHLMRWFPGGYR